MSVPDVRAFFDRLPPNGLVERAPAKVNLYLDVLGRREDGYHDLCMLNQTVSLWDDIVLLGDAVFSLSCDDETMPTDRRNLVWRAAEVFFAAMGRPLPAIRLHIAKRIPSGAGLGGGSADAAATLRLLNRWSGQPLTLSELEALGADVGSDVPFCVRGGTQFVRGRGEVTERAPTLPDCHILIVKPTLSLSTADMFARVRSYGRAGDIEPIKRALASGQLRDAAANMKNAMSECVPPEMARFLADTKRAMLSGGALNAVMTGSGSAVIGLFDRKETAAAVADALSDGALFVCLTQPVRSQCEKRYT